MYLSLSTPMLGIKASFQESIALAAKHGFEGVDIGLSTFQDMDAKTAHGMAAAMQDAGVRPGAAAFSPGRIPSPHDEWRDAVAGLPQLCTTARIAGYDRLLIVLLPFHESLEREAALDELANQLNAVLPILADHGQRLGVEYVAAPSRRAAYATHTVHNLAGTLQLLERLPHKNVGLLLDSFHWHGAGETYEDLARLRNEQIAGVHLNDAPKVPLDEQVVFERALPGYTGEIDLKSFIGALRHVGYDGPITCEPMANAIAALQLASDDDVVSRVGQSMREAIERNGSLTPTKS